MIPGISTGGGGFQGSSAAQSGDISSPVYHGAVNFGNSQPDFERLALYAAVAVAGYLLIKGR